MGPTFECDNYHGDICPESFCKENSCPGENVILLDVMSSTYRTSFVTYRYEQIPHGKFLDVMVGTE